VIFTDSRLKPEIELLADCESSERLDHQVGGACMASTLRSRRRLSHLQRLANQAALLIQDRPVVCRSAVWCDYFSAISKETFDRSFELEPHWKFAIVVYFTS